MQASPSAVSSADTETVAAQLADFTRRLFLDPRADHLKAIEEQDLTLTQVRALALLAGEPKPIAAGALAEQLGLSPAAITRALDTLVRRKLVSRRECNDDRRVRLLDTTAAGNAIVGEIMALRVARLESFVSELNPEQREKLAVALSAIGDGGAEQ